MSPQQLPPGWPDEVPPPGAPGWQHRAVAYLLDLCPADYRAHDVLRRQPLVLAYVATRHVRAALDGHARAVAGLRDSLTEMVPGTVVDEALEALDVERVRLLRQRLAADRLAAALAGARHVPRL
ncbi:hypothetical protein [Thalassiella azotivora]